MAKKKTKQRNGLAPDKYLTDEQLKKLRRYVRDRADLSRKRGGSRGVLDELIIELLAGTGLRASELVDLNIEDLPCEHGKPSIYVRDGKGNVSRPVDISEKLQQRLTRFVRLYRKGAKSTTPLFVSEQGTRLSYRSLYSKIRHIGEKARVGKKKGGKYVLHPHILRHTYLTRLYGVEHDLRFVQDIAGHASPTTTAIYAKTNNEARRRQVETLDDEDF